MSGGAWGRAKRIVTAGLLTLLMAHQGMAQAVSFKRGDRVREKIDTLPSEPKRLGMVVTVVAEPGDRIRIRNDTFFVNDQAVAGFSAELMAMVARSNRVPDRVPEDQYLVMGEFKDILGNVVRKWGTYSARTLERATAEISQ